MDERRIHHPVATLLRATAAGRFPPPDGSWQRVPPWRAGSEAVLAFTGHAVLAIGDAVPDALLHELGVDGFGGAHHPRVLCELAGPHGWIDSLDAVLAATGPAQLPAGVRLADAEPGHPRIAFARALREDVRAAAVLDDHGQLGVVTAGRGLGGLPEVSVEADPTRRGRGCGSALVTAARVLAADLGAADLGAADLGAADLGAADLGAADLGAADPVLAAVAPGNVASLRAFLGAGFAPVASVQNLRPAFIE